jgi:tripartite-type tricarboxylate transporter receptor subunit TctC
MAAGACAVAVAAETTAPYPARPIRLVVGFPPGGASDALARILAPKLSEFQGVQWVIDNRGGAGGNIATEIVARAPSDGYTLLLGLNTSLVVNPALYGKLPFDVIRDLQPIAMLAGQDHVVVVHAASVPVSSIKDLVALAKSKPGSLNYSSSGIGSTPHMGAELFKSRSGVNLTHVPYKGGGPAAAAVLGGEAHVMFGTVASLLPHAKSGRLRALATTSAKRSPLTPDLPTIAESGFPGFEMTAWFGLLSPAKSPADIVKLLHAETIKALALPDVQEALSRQGFESTPGSPGELAARIREETQTWAKVVKSAGIRAE